MEDAGKREFSDDTRKGFASIPDETPDEYDRHMLSEIASDPDCREFVSSSEAMQILGL